MNDFQLKQFTDRLEKLENFTQFTPKQYNEPEIINWISECINLFYEIGVDSIIIRNFLDHFSSKAEGVIFKDLFGKETEEMVNRIGPFQEEMTDYHMYRAKTGKYILTGSFYYTKVAFSSARNVLKSKLAEKRIVPLWLIESITDENNFEHLRPSLELIEGKYEKKDAQGLVTEVTSLLDGILNLDPDLKVKDKIGSKLSFLIENEAKRKKLGVSKDLLIGLNCGRILRNEKIIHKNIPIKYDFPFLIAVNFTYLVLFFFECVILNNENVAD